MQSTNQQVIVVTGAGTGIGKPSAQALAPRIGHGPGAALAHRQERR
ncbi:hypothetical protein [Cupriavidus sp. YAF13]